MFYCQIAGKLPREDVANNNNTLRSRNKILNSVGKGEMQNDNRTIVPKIVCGLAKLARALYGEVRIVSLWALLVALVMRTEYLFL